jgi:hypothetical protein
LPLAAELELELRRDFKVASSNSSAPATLDAGEEGAGVAGYEALVVGASVRKWKEDIVEVVIKIFG